MEVASANRRVHCRHRNTQEKKYLTPKRPPLNANFSWDAAREGMARAARNADPEWAAYFAALIIEVARRKQYFYTDDVEQLRRERGGPETHEQRAIGPMMRAAADAGVMCRTDSLVSGRWDKKVWFSLIFEGPNKLNRPPRRIRQIDPRQFELFDPPVRTPTY